MSLPRSDSAKALGLATFAGFLVSLQSVLTKAVGRQLNSQAILCGRSLVAALVCAAWLLYRRVPLTTPLWRGQLMRGAIGFGAASAFFMALVRLPVAEATVLFYLYPILAAMAAAALAGEPLSRGGLIGSLASFAGVGFLCRLPVLVGTGAPGRDIVGLVAGLTAAVLFALDTVLTRHIVQKDGVERSVFYLTACICIGSSHALFDASGWTPRAAALVGLIGLLFCAQAMCVAAALRIERTAPVAAAGYLQVVFVTLLGALSIGEWPDRWSLIGTALVLLGSAPLVLARPPAPPAPAPAR